MVGFNDDQPPENYIFKFEKWKEFWPEHLTRPDEDFNYAKLPVSLFIKPWYKSLTLAERGILLDMVEHTVSMRTAWVEHWSSIGVASGKHSRSIVVASIEKFERLGIVSDLTHRQGRKEERTKGRKRVPSPVSSNLSTTLSLSPKTLPIIDSPSPTLGIDGRKPRSERLRQITEVLENFEKYTQRKRGATETNKKLIGALLDSGYTVEDIVLVVRDRNLAWREDLKMRDYIEPKTIFRKSNFEGYLDKARDAKSDVSVQMRIDAGNLENEKILEQREAELEAKRNMSQQQREINRQKILEADIGFSAEFFKRVKENVGRGTESATSVGRELGTRAGGNINNGELQAEAGSGSHSRDDEAQVDGRDREVAGLQEPGRTLPAT